MFGCLCHVGMWLGRVFLPGGFNRNNTSFKLCFANFFWFLFFLMKSTYKISILSFSFVNLVCKSSKKRNASFLQAFTCIFFFHGKSWTLCAIDSDFPENVLTCSSAESLLYSGILFSFFFFFWVCSTFSSITVWYVRGLSRSVVQSVMIMK